MQEATNDQVQLVAFGVGAEEFAVPVHLVESIIPHSTTTKVPGAGAHVIGILNLRGKVISIVDLRRRFDMSPIDDPSRSRILVVQVSNSTIGVLVDSVSEVFTLDSSTLHPPPAEVDHAQAGSIQGIIRLDGRLIIVLDLERLFATSSEKLSA